jgi:hypothetical protein
MRVKAGDDSKSNFLPDFVAPTTSGFYRLCRSPERFLNERCRINVLANNLQAALISDRFRDALPAHKARYGR